MIEPRVLTIRTPDDWHLHLRDEDRMVDALSYTIAQCKRAMVMPNLDPPVVTGTDAWLYFERIREEAKRYEYGSSFEPLMTIYLTDETTPRMILEAKRLGIVAAAKLYPANATTNSSRGVTDIHALRGVFGAMEEAGLVLSIHGETLVSHEYGDSTRKGRVGQLHRESVFLKETLEWIVNEFPGLRIVLEHISTTEAVDFVHRKGPHVAATITAHHLLATLDDALETHHNKCMPILKEEVHRQALLEAATSANPKFFAGTDSAPHPKSKKETACGCAGCFTALHAIELYATAFEEYGRLDNLERFLSERGADFYGVPRNSGTITLTEETWTIPEELPFGDDVVIPFWAGKKLHWKVKR